MVDPAKSRTSRPQCNISTIYTCFLSLYNVAEIGTAGPQGLPGLEVLRPSDTLEPVTHGAGPRGSSDYARFSYL